MIENKKINIIIGVSLVFALATSILLIVVANSQELDIISSKVYRSNLWK